LFFRKIKRSDISVTSVIRHSINGMEHCFTGGIFLIVKFSDLSIYFWQVIHSATCHRYLMLLRTLWGLWKIDFDHLSEKIWTHPSIIIWSKMIKRDGRSRKRSEKVSTRKNKKTKPIRRDGYTTKRALQAIDFSFIDELVDNTKGRKPFKTSSLIFIIIFYQNLCIYAKL